MKTRKIKRKYVSGDVREYEVSGGNWRINVRLDSNPFIGRIVIAGGWSGNSVSVRRLFEDVCEVWPENVRVNFLMACGGFVVFEWPSSISYVENKLFPDWNIVQVLVGEAEKVCRRILNDELRGRLVEFVNYLSFGVDSYMVERNLRKPHVELVCLVDLLEDRYYWTGKSYPTVDQERGLVRISDLNTHFVSLDVGRVMILGCHDLTMFNNRNWRRMREWRRKIKSEFRSLAKGFRPTIVLHHPHETDSVFTWRNSWRTLMKIVDSVEMHASAGRYYNPFGKERSKLIDVLMETKLGDTIDFIIRPKVG